MHTEERMGSQHPWVKMSRKCNFAGFSLSIGDVPVLGTMRRKEGNAVCFHLFKVHSLGCFSSRWLLGPERKESTLLHKSSGQSGFPNNGR